MATIGCLGDIIFQVSSATVLTLDNMVWNGSARYSTHRRPTNALTEFTGLDPDAVSFDITLISSLGVDPNAEVVKLWNYERSGEAVPLTIGEKAYGKYRWSILSHKMKAKYFDAAGNITCAVVTVNLQEYLKS